MIALGRFQKTSRFAC